MGQRLSCCRLKWMNPTGNGDPHEVIGQPSSHSHHNREKYKVPYNTNAGFGDHIDVRVGNRKQHKGEGEVSGDHHHRNSGLRHNGFTFESTEKLQHISEREPEDNEQDPSTNATKETIFLTRSKKAIEMSFKKRYSVYEKKVCRLYLTQQDRLCSSCSSILLDDCTVSQPNGKSCLKALALAIYFHIRNRESKGVSSSHHHHHYQEDDPLEIFDERRHPINKDPITSESLRRDPDQREVYRFVRNLFTMAQLTAECTVVTLVYLERLVTYAEMEVRPFTWRRQILGAILLASKVWDDQAVWNVDYVNILKDLDVEDVNELERQYLELIQFNINIPPSVYAKYYFDLLALAEAHGLYNATEARKALSRDRARKLEAMASAVDDPFFDCTKRARGIKRFPSLDGFFSSPHFRRAVLS